MIFLRKVSDSHGEFSTSMVHVRPGSWRRITSLTSVWCALTGSVVWLRKLGETIEVFPQVSHLMHGMLTFGRLRKYVEVSTFDIPPMKLGMGSSAAQARGTPIDG